jgi:hypothetical protein
LFNKQKNKYIALCVFIKTLNNKTLLSISGSRQSLLGCLAERPEQTHPKNGLIYRSSPNPVVSSSNYGALYNKSELRRNTVKWVENNIFNFEIVRKEKS